MKRWNLHKLWPWLIGALILLWIYITLYSVHGVREILIPAGTDEFVASIPRIYNIIPINEDIAVDALVEEQSVSMTIQFTDQMDGSVTQVDLEDCDIHTNGYTSIDNVHTGDLPVELQEGHTYSIQYWAVCDGQMLDNLSLSLYGEDVSFLWLQVLLTVIVVIVAGCLYCIWKGQRHGVAAMLLLWCSLYLLYLLSMPLQLRGEEETSFARAYAVSNEMMGLEAANEDGYVYMDDQGLRDSGYLVYDVPYYRFCSNIGAAADASRSATVTYQDDGVRTLRTYVDAAAITLARGLGCSWPIVYLSGALLTGIIAVAAIGFILVRCKRESIRIRVLSIAMLPSLLTAMQLHSGMAGMLRPLHAEYSWLRLDEILRRLVLYLNATDGHEYLITYIPLIVLGIYLWNDLHKRTMPVQQERILLTGMTIAVAANALLRLQM